MELSGFYDGYVVVVSIAVAMFSSFVALATVPLIFTSNDRQRNLLWSLAFGVSMGTGIWSMHFIAMLAFHLPVPVHYNAILTVSSLLLAIVASALAIMPFRSRGEISFSKAVLIGTMMGLGISGMHYMGMAAMRLNAVMKYDPLYVAVSIAIAIVASVAALLIARHLRETHVFSQVGVKVKASITMGLAVSSMHYSAMYGMTFYESPIVQDLIGFVHPHFLTIMVIIVALLIEIGVLVTALLDEAYKRAKQSEQAEQRRADMNHVLSEILSIGLQRLSPEEMMIRVLDIILNIEWLVLKKKGSVFIVDQDESTLHMLVHKNFEPELSQRCRHIAMGECLCGQAAQSREIVYKSCIDLDHSTQLGDMEAHGHFCIPFPLQGKPLGVINLYLEHGHQTNAFEMEFLTTISDAVSTIFRQAMLERRADKVSTAIDQAGEAVIITDRHGTIEYVNQAFLKNTGFSIEEVLGEKPSILKSGSQGQAFYKKMWATILRGDVWQGEVVEKRKDGSYYPAMLTISPIRDSRQDITHFVGIHEDLTEHKNLEQQFRQAQKMESLGTLVGGIAHDFNNMLTGIIGNLFLIKGDIQHLPDVLEKVELMEKVSMRAADMIQQMMIFSRNEEVTFTEMSLTSFVHDAFKLHQVAVSERIQVVEKFTDKSLLIQGSSTQLQQVMLNLFGNAVHAMDGVQRPRIEITVEEVNKDQEFLLRYPKAMDEQYAHIAVSDNGTGIDQEHLEKIFDPFFTTKEVGKGTGLGLSMCAKIIQSHNGFIDVESQLGKGTTFHVYIPLLPQP